MTQAAHWDWLELEHAAEREDLVVVLLDDDDLLAPDYFATLAAIAAPELFVVGASASFDSSGSEKDDGFLGPCDWAEVERRCEHFEAPTKFDTSGSAVSLSLLRRCFATIRDRLEEHGVETRSYEDLMLRHALFDLDLVRWCCLRTAPAAHIPRRLTVAHGRWSLLREDCSAWRHSRESMSACALRGVLW